MSVASVLTVAGVVGLATLGSLAAVADDTDDTGGGYPIQVTVLPSTPTPTPTPTSSSSVAPTTVATTGATTSGTSAAATPVPSSTPTAAQLDTESVDGSTIGGALYVSGLKTTYIPSLDPSAGVIRSSFVIKNVSEQSIDSSVTLRLTNFLGQELSAVDRIYLFNLKSGETREVDADLQRSGQWAFTTASFTLTPTSLVEGERLPELTRDTVVLFPPWLVLVLIVIGAAASLVVRIVRAHRRSTAEAYG